MTLVALVTVVVSTVVAGGLPAKEKKISRTVTGLVLDKDENGIPRATVTLTDLQTGKKLAIYAGDDGRYQFSDLDPRHDYEVQGNFQGVASEARKVSSFDDRNKFVINLRIPPPKS
jgi:carboxypeptidase family protein